jgi:outer membrane protein
MKIRLAVPALAIFLLMPAAWAQSSGASASAKIGVINVQVAITSTADGKQAAAETRLRTGQTTLSDDEKARLAREGDQLNRSYQRKQQEAQDDFNDEQQDVVNRIGRKMVAIMDKYSRDNGYAVILDTSAQQTPVVYAAPQNDVTQDIIRLYDEGNPVKAGASGGASSSPRPAAPRPSATKP